MDRGGKRGAGGKAESEGVSENIKLSAECYLGVLGGGEELYFQEIF